MRYNTSSKVESYFQSLDGSFGDHGRFCHTRTLCVDNYIVLGQLAALRFIEWAGLNPGGVVALPAGKTPEFFIKWLQYYIENWDSEANDGIIGRLGLRKPDFGSLHLFQLNEFFPISPENERSFSYFVRKFYVDVFGFDAEKTNLINTYFLNEEEQEYLGGAKNLSEVFHEGKVDLTLRFRQANNKDELFKQRAIKIFDEFCTRYEEKIRSLGGIGFYLSGVGPDGDLAFNVKGSSPFSHTRLTGLNYAAEASAARDMGGITTVRKKAVVTIGLETITYNPDCVAVVIAAGQSKGAVVSGAVCDAPSHDIPASCLQKLPNARFYVTNAAGSEIPRSHEYTKALYADSGCPRQFVERLLIDCLLMTGKTIPQIIGEGYTNAELDFISELTGKPVAELLEGERRAIEAMISKGLTLPQNQVVLHTSPHHDDVELAYFPYLHHLVRSKNMENHFAYCTSGYASVTCDYLRQVYTHVVERIHPHIAALLDENMDTVFVSSYQDDVTMYLRAVANQDRSRQNFAVARRVVRKWIDLRPEFSDLNRFQEFVEGQLDLLRGYDVGRREPKSFHMPKSWLRELESELVWAHFGLTTDYVSHLRLPFYSDDVFPHYPDSEQDVLPALNLFEKVRPTIISIALDPEGSGSDTHFRTLLAISVAISEYHKRHPEIDLRIWGYRNVWSRYHISEVNTAIPVSLNSFAVIHNIFQTCYLSQKSADFPSPELDGPFTELAQKVWVEQQNELCRLLGDDYFYNSQDMLLKRSFGMIYLKDMSYEEFREYMERYTKLLATKDEIQL
ncbi:MAG: hypothetical protein MJY59_02930 [Bacteroidaceae bacterium]|nr:hypothetical protein [Bacteroidaceae bacterium]